MNEITMNGRKFFVDQYDSIYERGENCNFFVGKLNGETLLDAVREIIENDSVEMD